MLRTIYGFDDLGRKVPTGSYDDGIVLHPVGGRIFYIDPNSDEVVQFYDALGNVISNVSVGDTPHGYAVIDQGVSGKDKYYVYYDALYQGNYWTYYENGSYVNELTGFNSQDIGAGKTNTAGVMALHDGVYITNSGGTTVWYTINRCRDLLRGGCSDWFIGSKDELETLRLFINDNVSTLGLTDLFTNHDIWSSSESTDNTAKKWSYSYWANSNKSSQSGVVPMRSF